MSWLRSTLSDPQGPHFVERNMSVAQVTAIQTVIRRLREWTQASVLPPNSAKLLRSLMELSLREVLRRSRDFLPLPEDLETEIRTLTDRPARAMARYLGHHRARIYFNPAIPFPLADLFYVMCHEGYPGHLAEFVLKDDVLTRRLGYLDETVLPPASPRFVISEGIALLAPRMIFAPGEEMDWLSEHVFPVAGTKPPAGDLTLIHQARDMLYSVSCNASMLLDEGKSDKEVLSYLIQFGPMDHTAARNQLASLKTIEGRAGIFEYPYGKLFLGDRLLGPGGKEFLYTALTDQITPSQLN